MTMRLAATAKEAVSSLAAVRGRSILALFGIVIGIGSVIAMVSTGEIVKEESLKQFRQLGTDILTVRKRYSGSGRDAPKISLAAVHALPAETAGVASAAAWINQSSETRYGGKRLVDGPVVGVTQSFADLAKLEVRRGRFVSDFDRGEFWCVLGAEVATALRRRGAEEVLGQQVRIFNRLFTVVGVLESGAEGGFRIPFQMDKAVFLPIATSMAVSRGQAEIQNIIARMAPGAAAEQAALETENFLRLRAPGLRLRVRSAKQLIERMQGQSQLFTLLLGAVGSISLIVGGVGIMNVMLISVSERRGEIGLRRAIGARRRDIRRQFVIESVTLCLAGGMLGTLLGVAASWGICRFAEWPFFVSNTAMAAGVGVSTVVGIFFGFYPAHRASRLDPITALRS